MRPFTLAVLCSLVILHSLAPPATAWGDEGHRYINRVAAEKMPQDVPDFFRTAVDRLSFLGPEPDRWRDSKELFSALREASAPDHFIDIDRPEDFAALPNDRYLYTEWLRARDKDPKDIGFLPYSILEGYQKTQVLFRLWRDPQHVEERDQLQQNIIYYAGVLGHYVADASQPLHTTIHYNGWTTSSNPSLYSREPLHWRFEGEFVKAQIKIADFRGLVQAPSRLDDPFSEIMKYIVGSQRQVSELYRLEKTTRWDGANTNAECKKFVASRLAAGSQMLANLWYTAWLNSVGR